MNSLRYFKLANGDEIIADVIDWPDEESYEIVAVNVLRIVHVRTESPNSTIYHLKPWMIGIIGQESLITINPDSVVGISVPPKDILTFYQKSVESYIKQDEEEDNIETVEEPNEPAGKSTYH